MGAAVKSKKAPARRPASPSAPLSREFADDGQGLPRESPLATPFCLLLISLAALAAYHNSFSGPFVFDDIPGIVDNPSITQLWPITRPLNPSLTAAGAAGRPLVNLSLALNYALGGLKVTGYHIVNLLLHISVALVLFSVVLRTLQLPSLRTRFAGKARPLALATTVLWTVHPLLTESVTSVIQRGELIVGFFYLVTFYSVIRSFGSSRRVLWYGCAIAACLLGMASKEVMATAPIMVLLYDRAFVSGSFRASLKQRRSLYLGLAATWVVVGLLVLSNNQRNGTVGFGLGVAWWAYALTQCEAIIRYLFLALWPQTLVFDYGAHVVKNFTTVWPQASVLLVLLGATVYATVRQPKLGFAGCWFFGILAPSSSVIPLATQTMAEHRMYLPLLAVVGLAVFALASRMPKHAGTAVVALVAGLLGWGTVRRNDVYKTVVGLASDTVSKRPDNARAHNDLGFALAALGKMPEALQNYDRALQLKPGLSVANYNKACILLKMGQVSAAIEHFDQALRASPSYAKAFKGKGDAMVQMGRASAAIPLYEEALKLRPHDAGALRGLGIALLAEGKFAEAIRSLNAALAVDSEDGEAHDALGHAFWETGQVEMAVSHFAAAARLQPDSVPAHYSYARALARAGKTADAIDEYRKVVSQKPDDGQAYYNLGNAYAQSGELLQAVAAYEAALKFRPAYPEALNNCGSILRRLGRIAEAREHYRLALQYRPDYPQAQRNLAALGGSQDAPAMQE